MLRSFSRSLSATARASNRHPVIQITPRNGAFAEEFKANETLVQTMEPWVPPKMQKRAQRQRERRQLLQQRLETYEQLRSKVAPQTTSVEVGAPSEPLPHPDPRVDYEQRVAFTRQQYAYEIKMQHARELERQEAAAAKERDRRVDAQTEDQKAQEAKMTTQALAALEDWTWRRVKQEKVLNQHAAVREQRQEALAKLYNSANQFITPETLERAIETCLNTTTQTSSVDLHKMSRLFVEKQRQERQQDLMDVLNDTLQGRDSVATLSKRRNAESKVIAASSP
jgi:hypothetical protein